MICQSPAPCSNNQTCERWVRKAHINSIIIIYLCDVKSLLQFQLAATKITWFAQNSSQQLYSSCNLNMAASKEIKIREKLYRTVCSKLFHVLSKAETVFHDSSNEVNGKFYVLSFAASLSKLLTFYLRDNKTELVTMIKPYNFGREVCFAGMDSSLAGLCSSKLIYKSFDI